MIRSILAVFAMLASSLAFGSEIMGDFEVTANPPPRIKVKGELVAGQIHEIALLNQVRIHYPKFIFDVDFGLGRELIPDLKFKSELEYSYISDWICKQFGYGKVVGVEGVESAPYTYRMVYHGDPRKNEPGTLKVQGGNPQKFRTTVVCNLK